MPYPKPRDRAKSKLRLQLAAVCAALALTLVFIAVRFQTKIFLISTAGARNPDRHYSRIWFNDDGTFAGAIQQGTKLTIEQWVGSDIRTFHFDLTGTSGSAPGSGSLWAIASNLSRIAWVAGSKVLTLPVADSNSAKPVSIALPNGQSVLALSVLSDGSIATVFADASLHQWDGATGQELPGGKLGLASADQAVAMGDYLAISSTRDRRLRMYHFRKGQGIEMVEESPAPDPPYTLIIPAPGVMAALTSGILRIEEQIRNSPGALRSVSSHGDDLLAAGDFEHVYVLPADGEFYSVADAAPGSIISASPTHLAVSGPGGTSLFGLGTEKRLTASGRMLSFAGVGLLSLACVLACLGLLSRGMVHGLMLILKREIHLPAALTDPPLELIQACRSGEAVLWAGAGLSAQSGFPARRAFIAGILQAASVESWLPGPRIQKAMSLLDRGDAEGALDQLVSESNSVREQLLPQCRAIFHRFAVPSRSHELLARMPFAAAVTTNYDRLLEFMPQPSAEHLATLETAAQPSTDSSFLLRLYGDLSMPRTVLFSRAEFGAALQRSDFAAVLRRLFESRTIFFAGCSLEGLLADLSRMSLPEKIARKHFAVAGVSSSLWRQHAGALRNRYNIEAIVCDEKNIQGALPVFLEKIVREIRDAAPRMAETVHSAEPHA